ENVLIICYYKNIVSKYLVTGFDNMVRIKDIADRARVSSSTVSRVLNQDGTLSVADETRMRIIQIAKEMNYKTVQTRRSKQAQIGDTPRIGIMLCQSLDEELDDPYFLSIRHGIENKCNELGLFNSELFRYHHFNPDKMNREEMDALRSEERRVGKEGKAGEE